MLDKVPRVPAAILGNLQVVVLMTQLQDYQVMWKALNSAPMP